MENKLISLKEESPKKYKVYWGDRVVGTIVDGLKFFGIKNSSGCEVRIGEEDYFLKCTRKDDGNDTFTYYYSCELLSLDSKKIAEFHTDFLFGHYRVWNTFFTLTNKVNYLEYFKNSSNLSTWNDEDKNKISEYEKGIFTLKDGYIFKDLKDLSLIIMITAIIEQFIYKKIKRDSGYFLVMLITLFIFVVLVIGIFLKFK